MGCSAPLGVRAFNRLQRAIETLPANDRPTDALVEVALVFRRFALEHPALFSIAFHRADPAIWPRFRSAAAEALVVLRGLDRGSNAASASTGFPSPLARSCSPRTT